MAEFFCYEGIRNGATFYLDETTVEQLKKTENGIRDIVGRVVTITGNKEVGYGTGDGNPLGFVEQVEKENTTSDRYVVSVVWNQAREDIECDAMNVGSYAVCSGSGTLSASNTPTSAKVYAHESDTGTCIVYIHG